MQEILSKKSIGERIRILRINNSHSQLFVAGLLNLSRSNYSQIELGNQFPSFETLYTISRYYSKSYDWLLHGFEDTDTGVLSTKEREMLIAWKLNPPTLSNNKNEIIKIVSVQNRHSDYVKQLSSINYLESLPSCSAPGYLTDPQNICRAFKTEDKKVIDSIFCGDTVIGQHIKNYSQITLNDIYVIITTTNIILCRISNIIAAKKLLICKTDDLGNSWFTLCFDNIQEIWHARAKYSTQLEPIIADLNSTVKHLETALNKLEKEVTTLKSKNIKY